MAERNRYYNYVRKIFRYLFKHYPSLYHFKIEERMAIAILIYFIYFIYFNLSLKNILDSSRFPSNELNEKNTLLSPLSLVYIESIGGSRDTMRSLVT